MPARGQQRRVADHLTAPALDRRVDLLLAICAALAAIAYFPLNRPRGTPELLMGSAEEALPVVGLFVVPYLVVLPVFWALIARGVARPRPATRRLLTAAAAAFVAADLVFVAYPTVVARPDAVAGPLAGFVRELYLHDQPYNDLPSTHAITATLLALHAGSFRSRLAQWGCLALAAPAAAATLLLRQHSIAGAVAGVLVALACWRLAIAVAPRRHLWRGPGS